MSTEPDERVLRSVLTHPVEIDVDDVVARATAEGARRRRALLITRGVGIAVAGVLITTALVLAPRLGAPTAPAGPGETDDGTASISTPAPTPSASEPSESDDASPTTEPTGDEEPSTADDAATDGGPPPFQETPPLVFDDVVGEQSENAWPIPDARPSEAGTALEGYTPLSLFHGPNMTPVSGAMCDTTVEEAQSQTEHEVQVGSSWWTYYQPTGTSPAIDIIISGWDDAAGAYAEISTDTGLCTLGTLDPVAWPGEAPGEDAFINAGSSIAAVVLVGDYLVAVSVMDTDLSVAASAEQAAELASQITANLQALDPERTS